MQQLISKLAFQLRLRLNEMEWIWMIYFVCSLGSIELYVADWFMALAHSLYCIEGSRFLSLLLLHYCFLSSVLLLFSFMKPFFMTICGFTSILSFASGMELWAFRISSLFWLWALYAIRFALLSINKMRLSLSSMEIKTSFGFSFYNRIVFEADTD